MYPYPTSYPFPQRNPDQDLYQRVQQLCEDKTWRTRWFVFMQPVQLGEIYYNAALDPSVKYVVGANYSVPFVGPIAKTAGTVSVVFNRRKNRFATDLPIDYMKLDIDDKQPNRFDYGQSKLFRLEFPITHRRVQFVWRITELGASLSANMKFQLLALVAS